MDRKPHCHDSDAEYGSEDIDHQDLASAIAYVPPTMRQRLVTFSLVGALLLGLILGASRITVLQNRVSRMQGQVKELEEQLRMLKSDSELVPKDEEMCCQKSEIYMAKAARLEAELKTCLKDAAEEHKRATTCRDKNSHCTQDLLEINIEINKQNYDKEDLEKEVFKIEEQIAILKAKAPA